MFLFCQLPANRYKLGGHHRVLSFLELQFLKYHRLHRDITKGKHEWEAIKMISCSIHCRWILYESNLNAANPIWLTFSKRHSWGSKLVDVSSKGIGAEGQWKRQAGPQPKSSTANNRVCRDVLNLDPVLPCNINICMYIYIYVCIVNIWGYIHVNIYIHIYITKR